MRHGKSKIELLPEELLDKILTHVAAVPPFSRCLRTTKAELLVCKRWHRVSVPLFYNTVYIKDQCRLELFLRTLDDSASLQSQSSVAQVGTLVRSLSLASPSSAGEVPKILSHCTQLRHLDMCLDATSFVSIPDASRLPLLLKSLASITTITSFTLRKESNVYLTLPHVGEFFTGLAECIEKWHDLRSVYFAFKLSSDTKPIKPASAGSTAPLSESKDSPLSNLMRALSHSRIKTFATHLPSVWNNVLLGLCPADDRHDSTSSGCLATVATLKRIILLPGAGSSRPDHVAYSTASSGGYPCRSSSDHIGHINFDARSTTTDLKFGGLSCSAPSRGSSLPPPTIQPTVCMPEQSKAELLPPIAINSLYLATAARQHPQLMELIRAGWRDAFGGSNSWYGSSVVNNGSGRDRAWTWAGR